MKTLIASCLVVAVPLIAAAQDAKKAPPAAGAPAVPPAVIAPVPPPAPVPAKELDTVKPFLKAWACAGTNGNNDKITGKITMKLDLDKFAVNVRFDEPKTPKMGAFIGQAFMGVDPNSKSWLFEGFDNHGGNIHLKAATTAVTGDKMAFEGEASDPRGKIPAKMTFSMDAKTKHMALTGEFGGKAAFTYDCK
jgi:hypothetical protein